MKLADNTILRCEIFSKWTSIRELNFKEVVLFGASFTAGDSLKYGLKLGSAKSLFLHDCSVEQLSDIGLSNLFNSCPNMTVFVLHNVKSLTEDSIHMMNPTILSQLCVFRTIKSGGLNSVSVSRLSMMCRCLEELDVSFGTEADPQIYLVKEFNKLVLNNLRLQHIRVTQHGHRFCCFGFSDETFDTMTESCSKLISVVLMGCGTVSSMALLRLATKHTASLQKVQIQNSLRNGLSFLYQHGFADGRNTMYILDYSMQSNNTYVWSQIFHHLKPTEELCLTFCNYFTEDILLSFGKRNGLVWKTLKVYLCSQLVLTDAFLTELKNMYITLKTVDYVCC